MALGGGTYTVQNKVLPGAYINFVSKPRAMGSIGERGVVCMAMVMDWGPEGMMEIDGGEFQRGMKSILGYDYSHEKLKELREVFMGAKTVRLFRLNGGEAAKMTLGGLTATAKYSGERGNGLQVGISANMDDQSFFEVKTYLDGELMDSQTVKELGELKGNEYVDFSGSGIPVVSAAKPLVDGKTAQVTGSGYTAFLAEAEKEEFQVLVYNGDDELTKKLFVNFTKRMRDEEGVKFVTVLHDYPEADHEGVISVGTAKELVYWTAGMTAGANVNESLTNRLYDGELAVDAKDSKSNFEKGLQAGKFLFYQDGQEVRVLRDINSFTSFESVKNSDFSANRVIRVLDSIGNDVARIFSDYYLGKQSNNANGRNLLKAELIAYHEQLEGIEAIEGFTAEDIIVSGGQEKQDVVVYESVRPTDAMEKLYMKVEVV